MKHRCLKCGHEWKSNLNNPKSCPRCKRYDWKNGVMSGSNLKTIKEKK